MELQIEPGVRQGLFFDLERTISAHAVEQEVSVAMWRKGSVSNRQVLRVLWCYLRYNLGLIKHFEDLKAEGARVFQGRIAAQDIELLNALYTERLQQAIFPQARALIEKAVQAQLFVAIISSTYRFMVAPFAKELGINAFFGCDLEQQDGVCTGRLTGTIYHQEHKANCVQALAQEHDLSLQHSYAFGDSTNDVPMLKAVGRPVVINPGRTLKSVAQLNKWQIESWSI